MKEQIIITAEKKDKILEIRKKNPFQKVKFYTLQEFLNKYPYTYEEKALDYIMENYHVILPVAKIYLENITKYQIEKSNDEKCLFLLKIKEELIEKKLLQKNFLFENHLKKCEIIIDGIQKEKYLEKIFANFQNVTWKTEEEKNYIPTCYCLETIEEEITFVGEQIIKLLKEGISLEHIVIANLEEDYYIPLKRIFKMLGIPLELKNTTTINQTPLGRKFLEDLKKEGPKNALENLAKIIITEEENALYEQILNITNKYIGYTHEIEFIEYSLRNTKTSKEKKENVIKEINFKKDKIKDDTYCFILSFNETIPRTYKDEEFLSDKIKEELEIDTSPTKNIQEKETMLRKIKNIKHCILTRKRKNLKKECYPSPLIELLEIKEQNGNISLNVSNEYNEYMLAELLDTYVLYGTIKEMLPKLNETYKIPYRTYNNAYQKIAKEKIKDYLNGELNLSYTKLDLLNKCAFSYYLTHLLKLSPYEETFMIKIGNLFHKVLEQKDEENFDFEKSFQSTKEEYNFTKKEEFFVKILKEELEFTIHRLEELKHFTKLKNSLKELEFSIKIDGELKTTFKGIIDNLTFDTINEKTIYSILDYKTGNPKLKESQMKEGFYLQLPTYLYLLKKDPYWKKAHFGGFYLQPLITHDIEAKKGENILYTKQNALKRMGYSTSDKEILECVDISYNDSNVIAGLKTKKDGEFYNYSKILDQKDEETLLELVDQNIKKGISAIENAEFNINPKIFDNKDNISCEYCPFKDICYHEPKDNVYLKSDKLFLKKESDENGMDERTRISNP